MPVPDDEPLPGDIRAAIAGSAVAIIAGVLLQWAIDPTQRAWTPLETAAMGPACVPWIFVALFRFLSWVSDDPEGGPQR